MCSYDKIKTEPVVVDSIKHLDNQEQAETIADKLAKVSQEYEPLQNSHIDIPDFDSETIPVFKKEDVQKHLERVKLKKAAPPGDLPPLLIRKFAKQISIPLCDIINFSVKYGQWSKIYKKESVTPVPKTYPPKSPNDLTEKHKWTVDFQQNYGKNDW